MLNHGFHTILLSGCCCELTFRSRNNHVIPTLHPNKLVELGWKDCQTCVRIRQFHLVHYTPPSTDYLKHVSTAGTDDASECFTLLGNGIVVQDRRRHSFTVRCFPLLKGHKIEKHPFLAPLVERNRVQREACLPERSKGSGLGPDVFSHSRVQTPQHAFFLCLHVSILAEDSLIRIWRDDSALPFPYCSIVLLEPGRR